MKICLLFIGKPRDPHANALAAEYIKRSQRFAKVEMREIPAADDGWRKLPGRRVLLDPMGKLLTSAEFAQLVRMAQLQATDLTFVIGGADGLPAEWKDGAELLSLSRMTWPHELARAMLAEQIYRAFAILTGHPYAK